MTTIDSGITHGANGTPPPKVPLSDIDLGSLEFWSWDDDCRDGAFVTLRREAPIAFFDAPRIPGFESGPGHWGTDVVRPCAPCEPAPGSVQFDPDQRDVERDRPGDRGVQRIDDQPRRPAPPAAAIDRQPRVHPQDGGPHRGQRTYPGAPTGERHAGQPPRRGGGLRRVPLGFRCRSSAA